MKLHFYETSGGKNLITDYIDHLPADEKEDGYRVLQCLEKGDFQAVRIKHWQDDILEAYFYRNNRLFYVVPAKDELYILHACRKQKNKTEQADKETVLSRAKQIPRPVKEVPYAVQKTKR